MIQLLQIFGYKQEYELLCLMNDHVALTNIYFDKNLLKIYIYKEYISYGLILSPKALTIT